jgi:phosphate transport system substrate-binding protein
MMKRRGAVSVRWLSALAIALVSVLAIAVAGAALSLPGCGNKGAGGSGSAPGGVDKLSGGGSTFINPIMTKWAGAYASEKNVHVDYTASGSGNGIQQMIDKKNDFGCTDAPMNDAQLEKAKKAGGEVIHVPLVMGGVVPAYNLAEVKEPLRFTGAVLADIFLGKITKWNDPSLAKINPGVTLPAKEIAVVHRSDGSGTTYIWSDYLAKVSTEWKKKPGVGTDLQWPAGEGFPKNDGVAGHVTRTPGAIGYVELIYALRNNIQYGLVQNRSGEFIKASLESVTAAAEGAVSQIPDDLRYSLTDAPGKEAYPICGTTWAVLYAAQPRGKGTALAAFLEWATHDGQRYTSELQYASLPKALVDRVQQKIKLIKEAE